MLVPLAAAIVLFLTGFWLLGGICLFVAAFMALFFRNPHREIPLDENLVVAPADGRVTRVEKLNPDEPDSPNVVSIFLSVFDVHINRAPIAGKITKVIHTKGRFVIATREDASLINEQNSLTITNERVTIVCKQIAGILARRIVCWKKAGETVTLGERFGLIKFSSRTDLILPANVEIETKVGAKVRGGISIIGRVRS